MTNEPEDPKAGTYHGRAIADAAQSRGRFGATAQPYVVGSEPTVTVPGKLQSHQIWPDDQAIFGEAIDALPDMSKVGS
jgi:hypothetical protein